MCLNDSLLYNNACVDWPFQTPSLGEPSKKTLTFLANMSARGGGQMCFFIVRGNKCFGIFKISINQCFYTWRRKKLHFCSYVSLGLGGMSARNVIYFLEGSPYHKLTRDWERRWMRIKREIWDSLYLNVACLDLYAFHFW